nr:sialidase-1-like [Lytechinus pictus]
MKPPEYIHGMLVILSLCFFHICHAFSPIVIHRQELWKSEMEAEVHLYRTPILLKLPTGDLLAFSAPRKTTGSDKSAKFIAIRRSKDGGLQWDTTRIIEDDYDVEDGLNLGSAMVDKVTNDTFVFFGYCLHTPGPCTSPYREKGVYFKVSHDWGYTWTQAINVKETNPALAGLTWAPGPGFGIQKELEPNKGRLIGCGHRVDVPFRQMQCIYSDDHGKTWQMNSPLYGLPYSQKQAVGDFTPGETQVIELTNGTIFVSIRNENKFHCHCRMQSISYDGGYSFPIPNLIIQESLVDPSVFGSLALLNGTLFLSHPYNADSRVNMTLQWSFDSGQTWPGAVQLYEGPSEYSSLAQIDHEYLGLLFERDGYKYIDFFKIRIR